MKSLLTLFLFPLLIAIIGNNSHFQYCLANSNPIETSTNINPDKQSKTFTLKREVKFVPDYFACEEQKFIVRIVGAMIIFIPFYFPFKKRYEKKAATMGFVLRNMDNDALGDYVRRQVVDDLKKEIYKVFAVYIIVINALIFILGLVCKIHVFLYATLLYERFVNLIAWLV